MNVYHFDIWMVKKQIKCWLHFHVSQITKTSLRSATCAKARMQYYIADKKMSQLFWFECTKGDFPRTILIRG